MRRSMMKFFLVIAVMAIASLAMPSPAITALLDVGPVVTQELNSTPPKHGFPLWYRDTNRVPLEVCLSKTASANGPMCLTAEPNPGAPFSFPDNIGDEVFWWSAATQLNVPGGGRARLDMAIEGAYSTGNVVPGAQISFARIRIRVDTPTAGTYTITHPYGQNIFTVAAADLDDGINYTEDIGISEGGVFTGALNGTIGPFLYCTDAPIVIGGESFLGDPNVTCAVQGSTYPSAQNPSNFFRIQGPNGLDIQTNQFNVMGKIYGEVIPTPVKVDRVTYARDVTGMQVNAFVTTQPLSNATNSSAPFPGNFALLSTPSALQVSGAGLPTLNLLTNSPVDGKFFRLSGKFANPGTMPATIQLTNTADVPASVSSVPLTDEVAISNASYNQQTRILTVAAASSDRVTPPALQVFMPGMNAPLGTITNGQLAVTFPLIDNSVNPAQTYSITPENITVRSAAGGSATAQVVTFAGLQPPPATEAFLLASPYGPKVIGTPITFVASATGGSGSYEYQFRVHNGAAWTTVQNYSPTFTWTWNTNGLAAGMYTVAVDVRSAGSVASVEKAKFLNFELLAASAPATGVTLSTTPASPQLAGTTIGFSAAGIGGSGAYEYQFWLRNPSGTWSMVRDYSTSANWSWNTTGLTAGQYTVSVYVRNLGSTERVDALTSTSYAIAVNAPPATGATLTPNLTSPVAPGTPVSFLASATGGSGSYEYRYWLKAPGGAWAVVRDYSPAATWDWNTTGLASGIYNVSVYIRNAGSSSPYETIKSISYEIAP